MSLASSRSAGPIASRGRSCPPTATSTGYAARFNRRYGRRGYVFMGRFKSRIAESEGDLSVLIRYVHRNPLQAGIVKSLEALAAYPWSGHVALVGARLPHPFEAVDAALSLFHPDAQRARVELMAWMARDDGDETSRFARSRPLAPEEDTPADALPDLVRAATDHYALDPGALASGAKNARVARARAAAAYQAVVELGTTGAAAARALGVTRAAISRALDRGRRACAEDGFRVGPGRDRPRGGS